MRPVVAPDVLNHQAGFSPALIQEPLRSMNRDFQIRFTAGLLILLTTAAVILAWINFQKEADFQIPSDGVWWMETGWKRRRRGRQASGTERPG